MTALLLAMALTMPPAQPDLRARPAALRYDLPVGGPGPFVNFLDGDQAAIANASAHVAWAIAIPLIGDKIGGRKGLWIAGLGWMAETLIQEAFFHAPPNPSRTYASEVRSDLLTRLVPTAVILFIDLLHGEREPDGESQLASAAEGREAPEEPGEPRFQKPPWAPRLMERR